MEILFLGTCACDYSPLLQTTYKDVFDKNARRSSCALIDGRYLIDCGYHCLEELRIAQIDLSQITDIFVTHFHSDHYNVECISQIAKASDRTLRVWVRAGAKVIAISNVEWKLMKKGTEYTVAENVKVTGLPANHNESVFPQHILLEVDGKKIFYALDGAWFLHETYYALKNANLDFLVLDCTCGDYEGDYRIGEHNSIPMIRLMLPSLKKWGVITEKTQVYVSHLAPSLHKSHEETVEILQKDGVCVAYDGLSLQL
ncbi:MAG: MBL fold metallo-hydrolase [Clostridiales bacterium]|nr:MBL fold metallo-hydrolase [Clostridiales bacterium]